MHHGNLHIIFSVPGEQGSEYTQDGMVCGLEGIDIAANSRAVEVVETLLNK